MPGSVLQGKRIDLKNGQHFEVRRSMTCTSSFVIYMLICKSCGERRLTSEDYNDSPPSTDKERRIKSS